MVENRSIAIFVFKFSGMSSEELGKILPDGVEIGCLNGPKSQIVTGKKAPVLKLCKILEDQKVFVKEVPWACGIPYHSSFLSKPGAKFLQYLKEVGNKRCLNGYYKRVLGYSGT